MMPTYILAIPRWRPPSQNLSRARHWSVGHRLTTQTADILAIYAIAQGVSKATTRRRASLAIVLGPRQRAGDKDNTLKHLLDGLVRAGLLLNDNEEGLEGLPEVRWDATRRDAPETIITLTDVEEVPLDGI